MSTNDGRTQGDGLASYDLTMTAIDWRRLAELLDVMSQPTTRDETPLAVDPDDYPLDDPNAAGFASLSSPASGDAPPSSASDANRAYRQGDDGTAGEAGAAGTARTGGGLKASKVHPIHPPFFHQKPFNNLDTIHRIQQKDRGQE